MIRRYFLVALAALLGGSTVANAQVAQPAAAKPAQAAVATPVAAPASSPIPTEHFARIPFMAQPQLSPDGTAIGALMGVNGRQGIALLNPFNLKDRPVYVQMPDTVQADWIRWVNNDNLIVGVSALLPIPSGERWNVTRLFGINRSTGRITRLLGDLGGQSGRDVLWIANDGSPDILLAAQNSIYYDEEFWPTVWRVNVQTGKKTQVLKGREGVMDWFADGQGNVRGGMSYIDNSRTFRFLYRGPEGGTFKPVDRADTRKRESLQRPFLYLPGSSKALVYGDDENGRTAIYEVDMLTQARTATVFSAPAPFEVDYAFVSSDQSTLLGVAYGGAQGTIHWIDPGLKEIQDAVDKAVPGRRARIVSMTANRDRLLIMVDRPDFPGAVYFFDTSDGRLQRIALINEVLGTKPLAPVRMIKYQARDGLEIEAVLTLPANRLAQKLPIVMMPHGGPWSQDSLEYDYWAQFLASRGYAVLQPNFRGSTGYGSEFLRKGEGQMGLAMQDDITDGLAWAVKEGIADPARACIVGASYGGYAAMWGIAKDPDLYRCAVSIAGVANMRKEANDFGDALMENKFRDDWKRMTTDFAAVSPINAINRIKAPLLLIHGKKDITVDPGQSSTMYSRMRAADKTVELLMLPEADHHFTREPDRLALLSALETFLARHNPAGPPAAK